MTKHVKALQNKYLPALLIGLLFSISVSAQLKWGVKNYNYLPYNGIRVDSVIVLPDTSYQYSPNGSIGYYNHALWFKDTTWKQIIGSGSGLTYSNGWGLNLSGYTFSIDSSLVPTIWYADNRFYTKSQINAFFSGVTPISGYNKSNWDAVYSAYAAVQALSPAGWATQSALIDTANQLRAAIGSGGGGSGDMTKAVYDANNNGIVDVLELTGVVIGNNTSVPTAISGAANQLLRRNAGNTAYEFFTPTYQAALSGTGLVKSTGGTISYISDFSNDWNTAYSWGNHALAGYLTSVDTSNIGSFWQKVRSLFNGTSPIAYSNGNISLDTSAGKWRSENYYNTKYALVGSNTLTNVLTAGNSAVNKTINLIHPSDASINTSISYNGYTAWNANEHTSLGYNYLAYTADGGSNFTNLFFVPPTATRNIYLPDSSGNITMRVKVNGTTYNTDSKGTVDLGTIAGGGGTTTNALSISSELHSGGATTFNGSSAVSLAIQAGSVTNSMLANNSISIAGNSTALGGSVTQDQITGLSSTGLVKRTGANTLAIASGSDIPNISESQVTNLTTDLAAKESSFTEITQEFTGSTSMSITLSNTPKSGKAEMYFLNGVAIQSSNVSRTGTSVTLSGFTRWSSDVITAKYSY